jgi:hypothetical protein
MKLFYTGAEYFGVAQNSSLKSLGGFISTTIVPNNSLSNVFPEISSLGMQNGSFEVRGLVLKNTTGVVVQNIYLYQTYPVTDKKAKIEWAVVTIPDAKKMEQLSSPNSEPYQIGEWIEPVGVGDKELLIASLPVDGVIGLWIKRTILTPNPEDAVPGKDLEAYQAAQSKTEEIAVAIEYT